MYLSIKTCLRSGSEDYCVNLEFVLEFQLPLFTEMRRAEYRESFNLAPFNQFFRYQDSFHRFTDTNVVGDKESYRFFLLERHDERNHLVASRTEAKLCRASKRTGCRAERQTGRIEKEPRGANTAEVFNRRRVELRRANISFFCQRNKNAGDVFLTSIERLESEEIVPF